MAASPVLVDSSYYIGRLRQGVDPLASLALATMERDLAICGVVRCEVGRGLRQTSVLEKFQRFWDCLVNVPADEKLWRETLDVAWHLDRAGTVLPLTDILIACSARRLGAAVLTLDQHFHSIPGVRVLHALES